MSIVCPIDHKDDAIQKVSELIAGYQSDSSGTHRDTAAAQPGSGGRSDVARSLMPPAAPRKKGGILWLVIIIAFLSVICGGLGIFIDIKREEFLAAGIAIGVTVVVFGLILTAHLLLVSKRKKEYQQALLAHSMILKRWEGLYYCSSHDIVFDPTDGSYCERSGFMAYLTRR